MIDDLDKTLEELLKLELPDLFALGSNGVPQVTISFATPDSAFATKVPPPAIDFFLYDVRENLELRTGGFSVERREGTAVKTRPPARVDCSYLIRVWPSESDPSEWETEHQLLGKIMKVLLRYRHIPEAALQGSLKEQEPSVRAISLRPGNLQSVGEFWQAMGGKPKAALNYTLTISVPVYEDEDAGKLVVDKRIEFKQIL